MKASGEYRIANPWVTASSGCHRYSYWNEQYLFDGRPTTGWCTPSRTDWRNEFLEISFPQSHRLCKICMQSRLINEKAGFPKAFSLAKVENQQRTLLLQVADIVNRLGYWHEWNFEPEVARDVRLDFLDVDWRADGKYFLQIMCLEFYAVATGIAGDKGQGRQAWT
jgi:hypothetical protein